MSELCPAGFIKPQFHQSSVIKAEMIIDHKVFIDYNSTAKGQLPANAVVYLLMQELSGSVVK